MVYIHSLIPIQNLLEFLHEAALARRLEAQPTKQKILNLIDLSKKKIGDLTRNLFGLKIDCGWGDVL